MTWATSFGESMPYLANTAGAEAAIPSRNPGIFASPLGHRLYSVLRKGMAVPHEKAARRRRKIWATACSRDGCEVGRRMSFLAYLATPWTDISRKRSSSGDNVPALDGVRGLAVLIVVMSHCNFAGMIGQGNIGVLLFFVLSGFVLTLPLIEHPDAIYRPDFLLRFALNRTLRIYPAFLVAVL